MLNKSQKSKIVEDLADRFKRGKIILFSDFHGTSVAKGQELRRNLKKDNAEFKVAKKTLINLALKKSGIDFDARALRGEIGVVFGYGDEIAPAKVAYKFSRINNTLKLVGGIFGPRIISAEEVLALAKLPSREELIVRLVWTMKSPLVTLVNVLSGNIKNLVVVLQKIKDIKSS